MNSLYHLLLHYQTWIQYWIVLISWFGHVVSPRLIAVSPRFQLRSRILRQKLRWFNSNKRKKLKKPKESKANAQWFRIAKTHPKQVHLMLFHEFSKSNLSQVHTIFVSDHSVLSKFKTCQIVAGTNILHQFHEFFESSFWRVFSNWPSCVVQWESWCVLCLLLIKWQKIAEKACAAACAPRPVPPACTALAYTSMLYYGLLFDRSKQCTPFAHTAH